MVVPDGVQSWPAWSKMPIAAGKDHRSKDDHPKR